MKKIIRKGNRYVEVKVQQDTETASVKMEENAMKSQPQPKPLGGGWYQLPDGRKVRRGELNAEYK